MSSPGGSVTPVRDFVSPTGFKVFLWISAGLMTTAFAVRAYIRVACFRRLLIEDWMMLLSLALFFMTAVLAQIYVDHIYNLNHLVDGSFTPGPTFESDSLASLRVSAATSITTYIGLWIVKVNFLIFFYRLVKRLETLRLVWWIIFAFVIASGAAQIGIIKFDCMLGDDLEAMLAACSTIDNLYDTRRRFIVSVTLDVLTDFCVLCFPISILWLSHITLRQKIILSGLFSLVLFVIAITIVRGGFSANIHDPSAAAQLNTSANFWINLEYLVSFIVACCVSFRSLFTQWRQRDLDDADRRGQLRSPPTSNGRMSAKLRRWHDSVLETCIDLETAGETDARSTRGAPSGLVVGDFSDNETANGSRAGASYDGSIISLKQKQMPQSHV